MLPLTKLLEMCIYILSWHCENLITHHLTLSFPILQPQVFSAGLALERGRRQAQQKQSRRDVVSAAQGVVKRNPGKQWHSNSKAMKWLCKPPAHNTALSGLSRFN